MGLADAIISTAETDQLDWATDHHEIMRRLSAEVGEWSGIPMPLDGLQLQIEDRHPLRRVLHVLSGLGLTDGDVDATVRPVPTESELDAVLDGDGSYVHTCRREDIDSVLVNSWVDRGRHRRVYIIGYFDGEVAEQAGELALYGADDETIRLVLKTRYRAVIEPLSTSMERLGYALRTFEAVNAWDLDAEYKAREKLKTMVTDHQYRAYELTGSFIDISHKSRVAYMFRRLRPTIAMVPSDRTKKPGDDGYRDKMRVIAALCMHPIGYYARSYAGCMVPTDDVIAHLTSMRSDEAYFWRKANQHDIATAEAGL